MPSHLRIVPSDGEEPLPVFLARVRGMASATHRPVRTGILDHPDHFGYAQRFNTKSQPARPRPTRLPLPASVEANELLAEDERRELMRRRAAALKRMGKE